MVKMLRSSVNLFNATFAHNRRWARHTNPHENMPNATLASNQWQASRRNELASFDFARHHAEQYVDNGFAWAGGTIWNVIIQRRQQALIHATSDTIQVRLLDVIYKVVIVRIGRI